jgi:hypothetical protein
MSKLVEKPEHTLTSSLRWPRWAKPWKWMSQEFARLRAWFKYIRDNDPDYVTVIATLALDTDHWPDEIHPCASCGYPTPKDSLICIHCREEEEDYRDEQEMYRAVGHFK